MNSNILACQYQLLVSLVLITTTIWEEKAISLAIISLWPPACHHHAIGVKSIPSDRYSKVPNDSANRLLISKIFSYQHSLIWTYMLIKIQIIFPPTHLLSTIFTLFFLFSMLFAAFFCYNCFNNKIMYFHPCISFQVS